MFGVGKKRTLEHLRKGEKYVREGEQTDGSYAEGEPARGWSKQWEEENRES